MKTCEWVTDCDREAVGSMLSYLRLGYVPTCGHHGVHGPIVAVIVP